MKQHKPTQRMNDGVYCPDCGAEEVVRSHVWWWAYDTGDGHIGVTDDCEDSKDIILVYKETHRIIDRTC